MIVGIVNKLTGKPEGSYPSKTIRKQSPFLDDKYEAFELVNGTYLDGYSWDGQAVVYDQNYVPPHLQTEYITRKAIIEAIAFGNELLITFSAENIAMGITQAGKTKEVADYLTNVLRYVTTGSLYEVIAEIDRLIAAGLPVELDPFITETRLLTIKQQIVDYLS